MSAIRVALALIVIVCVCSACAVEGPGGAGSLGTAPIPAAVAPGFLPQLPAPSVLARSAAYTLFDRCCYGADTSALLPGCRTEVLQHNLQLSPQAGGAGCTLGDCAHAGYGFTLAGYSDPPQLHLRWAETPAPGSLWLALANYDRDCWEWFHPADASLLDFGASAPYFSAADSFFAVVLLTGNSPAELEWIGLGTAPAVWKVDDAAASGGDGLSWASAFNDLQLALAAAQDFDEIWVAQGTYYAGTAREDSFVLLDNVGIYGGFVGGETERSQRDWSVNLAILSGDIGIMFDDSDNSYHVLRGAEGTLDGFTVCYGNANGTAAEDQCGGGMHTFAFSPTIRNCSFEHSRADDKGGGLYAEDCSSLIGECRFYKNSGGDGGAVYCTLGADLSIARTVFEKNSSGWGGALSGYAYNGITVFDCNFLENKATGADGGAVLWSDVSGEITFCDFTTNSASQHGGAISLADSEAVRLSECTFSENTAAALGGALHCQNFSDAEIQGCTFTRNSAAGGGAVSAWGSSPNLTRCWFLGNAAGSYGGALHSENNYNSWVVNCVFVGNQALSGGAVFNTGGCTQQFVNCTFHSNIADVGGALTNDSSTPQLSNCIFFNDLAGILDDEISNGMSTPVLRCCDIAGCGGSGGGWDSAFGSDAGGNIDADPLVVQAPQTGPDGMWGTADDDYGDLCPEAGSPCIDAGDNAKLPLEVLLDILLGSRYADDPSTTDTGFGSPPIVDMGAYELQIN